MFGRVVAACALLIALPGISWAQGAYPAEMLWQLPNGNNLFSLLESAQAEITTDRFNSGGLNAGVPDRVSGFLASWSQSEYLIGGAVISSPIDGTPMIFPELGFWESVYVNTNALPLSIVMTPRESSSHGIVEMIGSGGGLTQSARRGPPSIAALDNYAHVTALMNGHAFHARVKLTAGGAYTRAVTFERHGRRTRDTKSAFVNVTAGPSWNALALVQQDARHVQSTYRRKWLTVLGGYTDRNRDVATPPIFQQADSVFDGPMPSFVESTAHETRWQVTAGAVLERNGRHSISAYADVDRASSLANPLAGAIVMERVAGIPARWWKFSSPGIDSRRQSWLVATTVNDRIEVTPTVHLDTTVRLDSTRGSASGATTPIHWLSLLPSLEFEWQSAPQPKVIFRTGVRRTADRLLLGLLAYGDPAELTADVLRWDGGTVVVPPVIMRVGPGTGADPAFSAIDPKLHRPLTDQFSIGVEYLPRPGYTFKVTGLAGRQSNLINVADIGVSPSDYSLLTIPDANADWVNPKDDQQLPVYNRKVDSFGRDRYLLTNPDVDDATMGAVIVTGVINRAPVYFRIDGTASASVGSGGNRGYTAIENDQAILGELFVDPNASTYARGRLFNDRAYTIKSVTTAGLPSQLRIGAIARFQDGQPFTRIAVVPNLNQGAEAIQTFPRGRSRFSYRATLDVRLQKRIDVGGTHLDLIADAYNLLNMSNEVEENVVTGPRYREITAVQPPRAIHLGARLTF